MTSISRISSATSNHQTIHPLQSSKITGLARELRNRIYSLMVEPRRSLADLTGHASDWFNPNVLLANRQIRREALEVIYKQEITVLVEPLKSSNFLTDSTKVLEGLKFKRCGIEIDLSGTDDEDIVAWANASTIGFLKGAVMRRMVFYSLVDQLNKMPGLEEVHIWSPRRAVSPDEGPRQQQGNSVADEERERGVDDEAGSHEDPAKDEALALEKLRQHDDAVFLENTTGCFHSLADTINVTIEGNLSVKDSKRILSLMDGPHFPWESPQGHKTLWRIFAVDTTRASCGSGRTRVVSKVLALSAGWVPPKFARNVWDEESAAAVKTFVDGGF